MARPALDLLANDTVESGPTADRVGILARAANDNQNLGDRISANEGAGAVGKNLALNPARLLTLDPVGNITVATDPLDHETRTLYDAMRRKIAEQNRNGASRPCR